MYEQSRLCELIVYDLNHWVMVVELQILLVHQKCNLQVCRIVFIIVAGSWAAKAAEIFTLLLPYVIKFVLKSDATKINERVLDLVLVKVMLENMAEAILGHLLATFASWPALFSTSLFYLLL